MAHTGRMVRSALLLMLLVASACSARQQSSPELIGKWTMSDTDPDGVHGSTATYDFKSDGTFEMSGYPPIQVKGKWRVVERAPGRLRLELTDQEMSSPGMDKNPWADQNAWGDLSDQGRTFTYQGKTLRRE